MCLIFEGAVFMKSVDLLKSLADRNRSSFRIALYSALTSSLVFADEKLSHNMMLPSPGFVVGKVLSGCWVVWFPPTT